MLLGLVTCQCQAGCCSCLNFALLPLEAGKSAAGAAPAATALEVQWHLQLPRGAEAYWLGSDRCSLRACKSVPHIGYPSHRCALEALVTLSL
jgi:hypothetical protein